MPLPDAPALLSSPEGTVLRATRQAAELAGESAPEALAGQRLADLVVREGSVFRVGGRAGALVRAASWPHERDGRFYLTVLVDVSDLVADPERLPPDQRVRLGEVQRLARVDSVPLREAQREARIGLWEWFPAAGVLRLSETLHELTGLPSGQQVTLDGYLAGVHPQDLARVRQDWDAMPAGDQLELEYRYVRRDGAVRVFRMRGTATGEPGGAAVAGIIQDVTDQRRAAETLRYRSTHDELTGLPNRKSVTALLARLLERAGSGGVAVLSCNIDNFKRVIDSLGHDAGDELLVALARRLQGGLPADCTTARLSGEDEFLVICPDLAAAGGLEPLVTRVSGLLRTPVPVRGQLIQVSTSIGVALPQSGDPSGADLLRFADAAMVEAQQRGTGQVALATPDLMASADRQVSLEGQLRSALRRDELSLHFQPVVRRDGSVLAAETLVRWPHPEHGLLSPGAFLSVARRGGLLGELDHWVLRTALREAAGWPLSNGRQVLVAVNLAEFVPGDRDFLDAVTDAVADAGIDWHRIVLELVETELVDLRPQPRQAMEQLVERGLRFAIDDFGTGYSSLARLKDLPAQFVKIDRHFVAGVEEDAADFAVVRAAVDIAHAMGRWCVAEGVETAPQFHILSGLGVEFHQGWLFSPPVPAAEFRSLLTHGPLRPITVMPPY